MESRAPQPLNPFGTGSESYRLVKDSLDRVLATEQTDHIAIVPYDTSREGEPPVIRYWSATHVPIFDKGGQFRFLLQHTVDITELQTLRDARERNSIAEAGLLMRAHEIQNQSQRLREMFAQAPGFVGILIGPNHVFQIANEAYQRLVGGRDLVGKFVKDALPEVVEQGFIGILDTVRSTGKPYIGQGIRVFLRHAPGEAEQERFVDFVYQPLRDDHGEVYGIFVQGNDVTEQKRAQLHLATIVQESAHRVKNSLAMAQAVVSASLRSAPNFEAARETIMARLEVLAVTQPALIEGRIASADVASVVNSVMDLHRQMFGRIHVEGPPAPIEPSTAQGLALILHELATNAIKYGALSSQNGKVTIIWAEADTHVELAWIERDGPPVEKPTAKGFGTKLIERALLSSAGNRTEMEFTPEGVCCRLTLARAKQPSPAK